MSGRWPTLLLYYLKDGTKRFSDLKRDNPGLSHRMLALELRKLEEAGIVRRTAHAGYPLRVDYDLTPAGLRLVPLIDALGSWWQELSRPRPQPPKRIQRRPSRFANHPISRPRPSRPMP